MTKEMEVEKHNAELSLISAQIDQARSTADLNRARTRAIETFEVIVPAAIAAMLKLNGGAGEPPKDLPPA